MSFSSSSPAIIQSEDISFINSSTAAAIDEFLMQSPGYSIDQLMELAGLAVATASHQFIDNYQSTEKREDSCFSSNILVLCGPGNNGGDALVAARHLKQFGYNPIILYPKQGKGILFQNLVKQCNDLDIPFLNTTSTSNLSEIFENADFVIDGLFGFSFSGPPREPYSTLIALMKDTAKPVISIDIPSGWSVDEGDIYSTGFIPKAVISLTAPKQCMETFQGRHYLGGRYIVYFLHFIDLFIVRYF
jgi:NAD(P)H-hydrate epimerase